MTEHLNGRTSIGPGLIDEGRLANALLSGGVSSAAIYRAALGAAHRADPAPLRILDFGSGNGQLLPLLAATFPEAALHAADIMDRPATASTGVTWHRHDLNLPTPIPPDGFEMIMAVEVIEHLENPRQIMREIARLLTPGGVAILTTPNTGSVRSLMTFATRLHHAQFDDSNYPAHITPLSEVDLTRIGTEAGLICERFFYTDSGTTPKLLAHRWQDLPGIGRMITGRRFSDNFGVVYRKPVEGQ